MLVLIILKYGLKLDQWGQKQVYLVNSFKPSRKYKRLENSLQNLKKMIYTAFNGDFWMPPDYNYVRSNYMSPNEMIENWCVKHCLGSFLY